MQWHAMPLDFAIYNPPALTFTPPVHAPQLVLSWHMNATVMCEYTKEEFVGGLQRMGVDSVEKLKRRLPEFRQELRDPVKWQEIYNYTFGWACEVRGLCRGP